MTPERPGTVALACVFFGAYGVLVVAGLAAFPTDGADGAMGRVILRVAAIWIIAVGLWQGQRWAWMVGLLLPALWIVLGLTSFLRVASGPTDTLAVAYLLYVGSSILLLGVAWTLLLRREARNYFRAPA